MMAVAAFALATGVQAQTFRQNFENAMAAQAKIDYDFEQKLRERFGLPDGKGIILVSSHSDYVSADYNCCWKGDHDFYAKVMALDGLMANPESQYFEATIRDQDVEGRAFIQRPADGNLNPLYQQALDEHDAWKAKHEAGSTAAFKHKSTKKAWDGSTPYTGPHNGRFTDEQN